MIETFPNIPNVAVDLQDGRLAIDQAPTGDVPIVIGTSESGPTNIPVTVYSKSQLLRDFGSSGSLIRGALEMMSAGATSLRVFRTGATEASVKGIANPGETVGEGYTVKTADSGRAVLSDYGLIYDAATDTLSIVNTVLNSVVYRSIAGVIDVDTGSVVVDGVVGDPVAGSDATNIGLSVPVCTEESDQTVDVTLIAPSFDGTDTTLYLDSAAAVGLLLGRLATKGIEFTGRQFAASEYVFIWTNGGNVYQRDLVSFSNNLKNIKVEGDITGLLAEDDACRFVLKNYPVAFADVNTDRIVRTDTDGDDITMSPGTDMGGLPVKFVSGIDSEAVEVAPHPMNLFEQMLDSAEELATVPGSQIVMKDIYFDSPAFDGQSIGEGKLPELEDEGYLLSSSAFTGGVPAFDDITASSVDHNTLHIEYDYDLVVDPTTLTVFTDIDLLWVELSAAISAGPLFTAALSGVRTPGIGAAVTGGAEYDYMVALGAAAGDTTAVAVVAAKATLDAAWVTLLAQAELDNNGSTTTPAAVVAIAALRNFETDFLWLSNFWGERKAGINKALNYASTSGDLWFCITTDVNSGDFGDGHEYPEALTRTARALSYEEDTDGRGATVFFDREISFNIDADGAVVPGVVDFHAFKSPALFFYRQMSVDGETRHLWFFEKLDADGNQYHEVSFGYHLAQICFLRGINDYSTQAVIGVRPPSSLFTAKSLARWVGAFPLYDDYGKVVRNGTGLLGNKFMAGMALDNIYDDDHQFEYGLRLTDTGYLDSDTLLLDGNGFPIDLGKYLSIAVNWALSYNASDDGRTGYTSSLEASYAGLIGSLAPWVSATQKTLATSQDAILPRRLSKRQINDLLQLSYTVFDYNRNGQLVVVDAPCASRKDSDFRREMTLRLASDVLDRIRDVALPYLGQPMTGTQKEGLKTEIQKMLSDYQRMTNGVLEGAPFDVVQTELDRVRGTALIKLTLQVLEELRNVTVEAGLAPIN